MKAIGKGLVPQVQHSTSNHVLNRKMNSIELDDVQFHQCVKLGTFEKDRTISFVPPDGEFELLRYRTTSNVNLAFKVQPIINESKSRVEYRIQVKSTFSAKLFATNVVVRIPCPLNTAKWTGRVAVGKAKYVPAENAVVWKIARIQGEQELFLSGEVELSQTLTQKTWSRPPISMDFQV